MRLVLLLVVAGLAACSRSGDGLEVTLEPPVKESHPAKHDEATKPDELEAKLLAIAAEYKTYDRVSDRSEWAPTDCRVPPPTGSQLSGSRDEDTHGRKLYYLYAKDGRAYDQVGYSDWGGARPAAAAAWTNPVGQVVVKEAFKPLTVPAGEEPKQDQRDAFGQMGYPREYAQIDGKWFRTGAPAGLFIMLKLDPRTPNTDQGWVYAVTSPDNKSILAKGVISSCVGCHEKTTRDRLYGPKWSWPLDRQSHERVPPTVENERRNQDLP